ncbi:MAG: hypothetical protein P8X90_00500 [Desulfobacterales bacterium]
MQHAADLAERLEAELIGLFVEDINLLRVAGLPFVREISFFSPTLRRLESIEMEHQLRAQAEQMRRIVAQTAEQRGVSWQFRVTRGPVAAEVLAAGADAARLCILLCHYRNTLDFQDRQTRKAQELAALFREVWRMQSGSGTMLDPSPYEQRFHAAMNDDLDTPAALGVLERLAKEILRDASRRISTAKGFLSRACNILGIRFNLNGSGA